MFYNQGAATGEGGRGGLNGDAQCLGPRDTGSASPGAERGSRQGRSPLAQRLARPLRVEMALEFSSPAGDGLSSPAAWGWGGGVAQGREGAKKRKTPGTEGEKSGPPAPAPCCPPAIGLGAPSSSVKGQGWSRAGGGQQEGGVDASVKQLMAGRVCTRPR